MNKNNFYISFGIWIAIIPLLGVPIVWRNALVTLSGLFLVLVFLGPTILKRLQSKPKSKKKQSGSVETKDELKFSAPENAQAETEAEKEI